MVVNPRALAEHFARQTCLHAHYALNFVVQVPVIMPPVMIILQAMIVILVTDPSGREQVPPGDGLLQW